MSSRITKRMLMAKTAFRTRRSSTSVGVVPAAAAAALNDQGFVVLRGVLPPACLADGVPSAFVNLAQETWRLAGFNYKVGDYEAGSVERETVKNGSDSSTKVYDVAAGSPAHQIVQAHAENAYLQCMPHFAAFGCLRPADQGGEMTLTNLSAAGDALPSSLLQKLRGLGITYIRRMGDAVESPQWPFSTGYWQTRFHTQDWATAQRTVQNDHFYGGSASLISEPQSKTCALVWTVAGTASPPLPCGSQGKPVVATSILGHHELNDIVGDSSYTHGERWPSPKHCTWGDGSPITRDELEQLEKAYEDANLVKTILLDSGDMVVVNNYLWAHGRLTYIGQREHVALFSEKVHRGVPEAPASAL